MSGRAVDGNADAAATPRTGRAGLPWLLAPFAVLVAALWWLVAADPQRPLDAGILRALWLTPDEIRARHDMMRSPVVLRGLEDYLAGKRFPLELIYTHPNSVYTYV